METGGAPSSRLPDTPTSLSACSPSDVPAQPSRRRQLARFVDSVVLGVVIAVLFGFTLGGSTDVGGRLVKTVVNAEVTGPDVLAAESYPAATGDQAGERTAAGHMATNTTDATDAASQLVAAPDRPVSGERSVLYVIASTPKYPLDLRERDVASVAAETAEHLRRLSGNRLTLSSHVETVVIPHADCESITGTIALVSQHTNTSSYDHVVVITNVPCEQSGLGLMNNSGVVLFNGSVYMRLVAHELGHNLGLRHGARFDCADASDALDPVRRCTSIEYGDPSSMLGAYPGENLSAVHLWQLGWVDPADIHVGRSGTHRLGSGRGGARAVVIDDRHGGEYWLEWQHAQHDNQVQLRWVSGNDTEVGYHLINMAPQRHDAATRGLSKTAETYTEPGGLFSVSVRKIDDTGATIELSLPASSDVGAPVRGLTVELTTSTQQPLAARRGDSTGPQLSYRFAAPDTTDKVRHYEVELTEMRSYRYTRNSSLTTTRASTSGTFPLALPGAYRMSVRAVFANGYGRTTEMRLIYDGGTLTTFTPRHPVAVTRGERSLTVWLPTSGNYALHLSAAGRELQRRSTGGGETFTGLDGPVEIRLAGLSNDDTPMWVEELGTFTPLGRSGQLRLTGGSLHLSLPGTNAELQGFHNGKWRKIATVTAGTRYARIGSATRLRLVGDSWTSRSVTVPGS